MKKKSQKLQLKYPNVLLGVVENKYQPNHELPACNSHGFAYLWHLHLSKLPDGGSKALQRSRLLFTPKQTVIKDPWKNNVLCGIFPHKSLKKERKAQVSAKIIVAYEQSQFSFNVVT